MAFAHATAVTASAQTGVKELYGWQFAENAGATARVLIRDGSVTGTIVCDIHLGANQSAGDHFPRSIKSSDGWYVQVSSGAVRGAIYGG